MELLVKSVVMEIVREHLHCSRFDADHDCWSRIMGQIDPRDGTVSRAAYVPPAESQGAGSAPSRTCAEE